MQLLEVIILKTEMLLIEEMLHSIDERKHLVVERTWILAHLGLNFNLGIF